MRAKAAGRVVDADHAGGVLEIVLGGIEQPAVRREHAMAEEVPAGRAGDGHRRDCAGVVEHHGEGAGPAREHHRAAGDRIVGHVVAAVGQRRGEQQLAVLGQDRDAAGAVLDLVGGGKNRLGLLDGEQPLRRQRRRKGRACRLHEIAPVDRLRRDGGGMDHGSVTVERGEAGAQAQRSRELDAEEFRQM